MTQPLVSIVIPAFNAGAYLQEAIDSVLHQSYPHVELIVLDDGSTDDTREILNSYDKGCFYWESHPNMGQSATLNKGWALAQGELLGYLSADDRLLPDAVRDLVDTWLREPEVVAVYGDFLLINEQGETIGDMRGRAFDYARMISHLHCPIGPGALFVCSAFVASGGWNSALRLVPDFDFWLRLGTLGKIRHVPVMVASWRIHAQSQTNACADPAQADEVIGVIRYLYDDARFAHRLPVRREHAFAQAYVFCAAKHFSAGRYGTAIQRLRDAWRQSPGSLCSVHSLRLIFGAMKMRCRFYWQQRR